MARMLLAASDYSWQCGCCQSYTFDRKGKLKSKRAQRRREKQQFRKVIDF